MGAPAGLGRLKTKKVFFTSAMLVARSHKPGPMEHPA
jgi:hypothetical protein